MKFKKGDIVKVIGNGHDCTGCQKNNGICWFFGGIGTVKLHGSYRDDDGSYRDDDFILVTGFPPENHSGFRECSGFLEHNLELIKKEIKPFGIVKFMETINKKGEGRKDE